MSPKLGRRCRRGPAQASPGTKVTGTTYQAQLRVFGEDSLNVFGYSLLESNDIAGAIQVFKLNADMFADSNVWDSLAEGYLKAGDVRKAQENYEKALKLDPANQSAKEALQRIKDAQPNPKQK